MEWSEPAPAGWSLHRALLLPLHRGERLGEGGGGGPPALQGPPGQQPHGVLGAEQRLRHTLHWRGDHHTRQEDGRHQDHQQGGLRPGNKVDSIFRKKNFFCLISWDWLVMEHFTWFSLSQTYQKSNVNGTTYIGLAGYGTLSHYHEMKYFIFNWILKTLPVPNISPSPHC